MDAVYKIPPAITFGGICSYIWIEKLALMYVIATCSG